jgi:cytochrome c551/c552
MVEAKDPEKEQLTYLWNFGNGMKEETKIPTAEYTYSVPGEYAVSVQVFDTKEASSKSNSVKIYAGNEEPAVDINVSNKTFYFPGKSLNYSVNVKQGADTSSIDSANLMVIADYVEGNNKEAVPMGHFSGSEPVTGKNIMLVNDCKSCHKENEKSIGPSFMQVSMKYKNDPRAPFFLVDKVKKGGSGVWGETAMSAHPDLPVSDIQQIIQWVLSLSNSQDKKKSLPASGSLDATLNKPVKDNGVLYLTASYTNKGGANIKPLTGKKTLVLRNSKITFSQVSKMKDYTTAEIDGNTYLVPPKGEGWFTIDSIDLSGIKAAELMAGSTQPVKYGYDFELRLDAPDGKIIGTSSVVSTPSKNSANSTLAKFNLEPVTDNKIHNLYIVSKLKDAREDTGIGLKSLKLIPK